MGTGGIRGAEGRGQTRMGIGRDLAQRPTLAQVYRQHGQPGIAAPRGALLLQDQQRILMTRLTLQGLLLRQRAVITGQFTGLEA